jgi:hypothetical protein
VGLEQGLPGTEQRLLRTGTGDPGDRAPGDRAGSWGQAHMFLVLVLHPFLNRSKQIMMIKVLLKSLINE